MGLCIRDLLSKGGSNGPCFSEVPCHKKTHGCNLIGDCNVMYWSERNQLGSRAPIQWAYLNVDTCQTLVTRPQFNRLMHKALDPIFALKVKEWKWVHFSVLLVELLVLLVFAAPVFSPVSSWTGWFGLDSKTMVFTLLFFWVIYISLHLISFNHS